MATTGMNPAEVRRMADQLRQAADRLRNVVATVDARVLRTSWVGPQADRFLRQAWPGNRKRLLLAADGLSGLARSAWDNADEQERVSGVTGSGGSNGLYRAADTLLAVTGSLAYKAGRRGLDALHIATGYASMSKWHAAAWSRMFDKKLSTMNDRVRAIAGRLSPILKRVEKHPFIALKNSPVAAALRRDGAVRTVFSNANKVVEPLRKVLGFTAAAEESARAVQAWRSGDKVGAVMGGADAAAAVAKRHPLLLVKGIGYGVDAITDIADIARGKQKPTEWKPWTLL